MHRKRILVIGSGVGGLAAALDLAAKGFDVTVLERAGEPGGKLREARVDGVGIDSGPTVFTMRWVFEQLFADAGLDFARAVPMQRASVIARHAWVAGGQLDLHADVERSADAIGAFAGIAEARRFRDFSDRARRVYTTLEGPFIRSSCASPLALTRALGMRRLGELFRIAPFERLWRVLGRYFRDPRLRQLFGRYATYCGSSPFLAPATLMLVAHVEQDGVWLLRDGMHSLARAMADAARRRGARIRFDAEVRHIVVERGAVAGVALASGERIAADAVVVNADAAAVADGHFGADAARAVTKSPKARSLSAMTWMLRTKTDGFALHRHNVFFSSDYAREFDEIFKRSRIPGEPTVYVCAQDRVDTDDRPADDGERLLCLVNAPADGDTHLYDAAEIRACEARTFDLLQRCGLTLSHSPERREVSTPSDFNRRYPATGGALYGPASHGWKASFQRNGSRSRIRGLYFAGGSVHPGPGVPMAALSGRLAAASLIEDSRSTVVSLRAATPGGTSTGSAMTDATRSR